jgi:non-ribosomal peptide synthetase component F
VNHYGPTENTVVATAGVASPAGRRADHRRPISNVKAYLLDGRMEPSRRACSARCTWAGEAWPGDTCRADMTAAAFVPDPFSETGESVLSHWRRVRHTVAMPGRVCGPRRPPA